MTRNIDGVSFSSRDRTRLSTQRTKRIRGPLGSYLTTAHLVLFGTLSLTVQEFAQAGMPIVVSIIIDHIGRLDSFPTRAVQALILLSTVIITFRFVGFWALTRASTTFGFSLRAAFHKSLFAKDTTFYRRWMKGDLISRFATDITAIRTFFDIDGWIVLVIMIAQFLTRTVGMTIVDWQCALSGIIPCAITSGVSIFLLRRTRHLQYRFHRANATLSSFLCEDIEQIKRLKALGVESNRAREFAIPSSAVRDNEIKLAVWQSGYEMLTRIGSTLGLLSLFSISLLRMRTGRLSVGDFVALHLFYGLLLPALQFFVGVGARWQATATAWARIMEVLWYPKARAGQFNIIKQRAEDPPMPATLEVEDLEIRHGHHTLVNVKSLSITPGETVCIVGQVGCGKSQLAEALLGLRFFDRGIIRATLPDDDSRNVLFAAYVSQQPQILERTIQDNVALSIDENVRQTDRQERIKNAIFLSGLDEDLHQFPKGLQTWGR